MDPLIGEIKMFAGNFAPKGWALCNGSLMSISQNSALFSILGTTYGGDGSSSFALPNLQGRTPVHVGQGPGSYYPLGAAVGTENVTILSQQMPSHIHAATATVAVNVSIDVNTTTPNQGLAAGNYIGYNANPEDGTPLPFYSDAPTANSQLKGVTATGTSAVTVAAAGGNSPLNIVQPVLAVNFIIATEGIYPSRP
ncbi:phage tail protein [Mucilaginibacter phyllosphaerae]|nr:tail fiber protein [Mucilaginibacter phyllosphaerae]MBB3969196.1 microcystin-dependent protein [Mucilaginibacter phyllosphaerae]GGH06949.1 tail Collar domain-containing protein [Mucilaginibacter phyllosphaerae]